MTSGEDSPNRELRPTLLGEVLSLGPRLASRTISQIQASQLLMSLLSCSQENEGGSDAVPTPGDAHQMREPVDVLGVLREDSREDEPPDPAETPPEGATTLDGSAVRQTDSHAAVRDAADLLPADEADSEVPEAADLVIPGYDSLAASQVVPRLTTLSSAELSAIGAYEEANRGRRTILNRVRQLRASADGDA